MYPVGERNIQNILHRDFGGSTQTKEDKSDKTS
jgi:hypothetical protein